jgi:hypothetical protein
MNFTQSITNYELWITILFVSSYSNSFLIKILKILKESNLISLFRQINRKMIFLSCLQANLNSIMNYELKFMNYE